MAFGDTYEQSKHGVRQRLEEAEEEDNGDDGEVIEAQGRRANGGGRVDFFTRCWDKRTPSAKRVSRTGVAGVAGPDRKNTREWKK